MSRENTKKGIIRKFSQVLSLATTKSGGFGGKGAQQVT
jgi:hypothetical protein